MSQGIHRKIRNARLAKEKDNILFAPDPLPEHPTVNPQYVPESPVEIYYFQKYAMLLALAHSQVEYVRELNEYIDYLEKKVK